MDSIATHTWSLAAHTKTSSARLRPFVLGHGVPAWHVHGLHSSIIESDQLRAVNAHTALLRVRSVGCVAGSLHWADSQFADTQSTASTVRNG